MKLIPLGSNQTVLEYKSGAQVLFSYKTPVAAYIPGEGYFRTKHYWSSTTSKHINKWLRHAIGVAAVEQSIIDNFAGL